jgi:hypothetical protein
MTNAGAGRPATAEDSGLLAILMTRHASIEQRGISVITTTGTLVTLLVALVGLAGQQSNFKLDQNKLGMLPLALWLLVAAIAFGLLTNFPLWLLPKTDDLITIATHIRKMNFFKSWVLAAALLLQLLGIAVLASIVLRILGL